MDLNNQQNFNFNDRNNFINVIDTSGLKVGKNILVNRLTIITGLIKHDWMNITLNSYKVKCKNLFFIIKSLD